MTVNLIKMSVGIEDINHLKRKQKQQISKALSSIGEPELVHITRNTPRRAAELLQGGSIYWVIKRYIRVRQLIKDIRQIDGVKGKKSCVLVLKPELIRTEIIKFRAFQGWRYLSVDDVPVDLSVSSISGDNIPEHLVDELKILGLL
jgi:hypothetical protein